MVAYKGLEGTQDYLPLSNVALILVLEIQYPQEDVGIYQAQHVSLYCYLKLEQQT